MIKLDKADRFKKIIELRNKQKVIDKEYAKNGLTDEVLDAQVELNTSRHELDIPDENNFVYEKYVQ